MNSAAGIPPHRRKPNAEFDAVKRLPVYASTDASDALLRTYKETLANSISSFPHGDHRVFARMRDMYHTIHAVHAIQNASLIEVQLFMKQLMHTYTNWTECIHTQVIQKDCENQNNSLHIASILCQPFRCQYTVWISLIFREAVKQALSHSMLSAIWLPCMKLQARWIKWLIVASSLPCEQPSVSLAVCAFRVQRLLAYHTLLVSALVRQSSCLGEKSRNQLLAQEVFPVFNILISRIDVIHWGSWPSVVLEAVLALTSSIASLAGGPTIPKLLAKKIEEILWDIVNHPCDVQTKWDVIRLISRFVADDASFRQTITTILANLKQCRDALSSFVHSGHDNTKSSDAKNTWTAMSASKSSNVILEGELIVSKYASNVALLQSICMPSSDHKLAWGTINIQGLLEEIDGCSEMDSVNDIGGDSTSLQSPSKEAVVVSVSHPRLIIPVIIQLHVVSLEMLSCVVCETGMTSLSFHSLIEKVVLRHYIRISAYGGRADFRSVRTAWFQAVGNIVQHLGPFACRRIINPLISLMLAEITAFADLVSAAFNSEDSRKHSYHKNDSNQHELSAGKRRRDGSSEAKLKDGLFDQETSPATRQDNGHDDPSFWLEELYQTAVVSLEAVVALFRSPSINLITEMNKLKSSLIPSMIRLSLRDDFILGSDSHDQVKILLLHILQLIVTRGDSKMMMSAYTSSIFALIKKCAAHASSLQVQQTATGILCAMDPFFYPRGPPLIRASAVIPVVEIRDAGIRDQQSAAATFLPRIALMKEMGESEQHADAKRAKVASFLPEAVLNHAFSHSEPYKGESFSYQNDLSLQTTEVEPMKQIESEIGLKDEIDSKSIQQELDISKIVQQGVLKNSANDLVEEVGHQASSETPQRELFKDQVIVGFDIRNKEVAGTENDVAEQAHRPLAVHQNQASSHMMSNAREAVSIDSSSDDEMDEEYIIAGIDLS